MGDRSCDHQKLLDAVLGMEIRDVSEHWRQQAIVIAFLEDAGPLGKAGPPSRPLGKDSPK